MNAASSTRSGRVFVLHDEPAPASITPDHFEPAWWRLRGATLGTASGRGTVMFVRPPGATPVWVLRHYHRGGWIARFSRDRYVWTGLEATRPWREWRLTRRLRELDLPVPTPIAARVVRHGLTYAGDLLTQRIENAATLASILRARALPADAWSELGALLRRFHDAGVRHDDINVSNILLGIDGRFHVIDFDKAAIVRPGAWREHNLSRFRRSLEKHRALAPAFAFTPADWTALQSGYR